jgi:hypothetical protein
MRGLVLDENISPAISIQVSRRRPDISIQSLFHWRGGTLANQPDDLVLQATTEDGLTLVTYDVTTIRPLVAEWAAIGRAHAGVVFINRRTIRSNDFGGIIRALELLWDLERLQNWTNRTQFLVPA